MANGKTRVVKRRVVWTLENIKENAFDIIESQNFTICYDEEKKTDW